MKHLLLSLFAALAVTALAAPKTDYHDALQFTLVGKLMPGTPNPYHRVDTVKYKGFTTKENLQVRESAGMAIAFRTNSTSIAVKCEFGEVEWPQNSTGIAAHGFDLYIKVGQQWRWAGSGARTQESLDKALTLVANMDGSEHDCLLYLPLFAEVRGLQIGVSAGAKIEALSNPFSHRIAIWGSSFTHGTSTSRPGMAYPAQVARATGWQLLSLGCSGNCKLQPYFADVLANVDADAFVFDCFSNPSAAMIEQRLLPFIERMTKAHPGKPLIFQQTIDREYCTFNTAKREAEEAKIAMTDSLMAIAVKKYPNVYFIRPNATAPNHEATVDGIHPDNYGYTLWANSIIPQLKAILTNF